MAAMTAPSARAFARVEYPTLALLLATYVAWMGATFFAASIGIGATALLVAVLLAQHSSLQHEVIHGHPFRNQRLNDALVFPALGLLMPYERFRAMHLAHHNDPTLTDPHDDPESNFLDPQDWTRRPAAVRLLLSANNTLLGRMLLGPVIGTASLWWQDVCAAVAGDRDIRRAYLLHAAGVFPVFAWLATAATMPLWAYLLGAWGGLSILRIRTFLEHRAHERAAARSVIIEDCGPLALLFLNNNFHAVHHAHPKLPWYKLPGEYARRQDEFLRRNGGYRYRSYAEVFARHFLSRKDPVAHPLRPEA